MKYSLYLRADESPSTFPSRKAALAVARTHFGGRVYQSHSYRTDDGHGVSLYGSRAECLADQDGAEAARLSTIE